MTVEIYRVGGAVRDHFLGLTPKDIDFAVEASDYQEMKDYIASNGKIFLEKSEFFTIRAKVNNIDADFVLCRKEHGYTDGRRPDAVSVGNIYDDLSRRDFTMNAIAVRESDHKVFDPHNGLEDLKNGIIRCVGKAEDRFSEDSLRMVRAVRFHITKGFKLDRSIEIALKDETLLSKLWSISKERIREELNRCFKHDTLKTMMMLEEFPRLREIIFSDTTMWLEATTKNKQ